MLNYIFLFLNSCYLSLNVLWFVNFKTFFFPSFHLPTYSPTNLNLLTHLSTYLSTYPLTHLSINLLIYLLIFSLFIHPPTYSSTYLPPTLSFNLVSQPYEMFTQNLLKIPSHFTTWWNKKNDPHTYPSSLIKQNINLINQPVKLVNQPYQMLPQILLTKWPPHLSFHFN
jgi:hypothetical protein